MSYCMYRRLPLEGLKVKVKRNLKLLEAEGLVSAENDYQELINAIAKVCMYQHLQYCHPLHQ